MLSTNIEHSSTLPLHYSSLGDVESRLAMHQAEPGRRRRRHGSRTSSSRRAAERKCCGSCCCCGGFMWRLINCFRNSGPDQICPSNRPVASEAPHAVQYEAPVVVPSPRGGSVSSCDEDQDFERGTLLPKFSAHSPEATRQGAASSPAAAAGAGADVAAAAAAGPALQEQARHRRTGSDGSRGQLEGVRALVLPAAAAATGSGSSSAGGSSAAAAAAAKAARYGTCARAAEFAAVAELLGPDADDEDFCPTCLEVYSSDNPKIFTRCGHSFHMQCIYAWLERKNTCPLCESPMDLQDDVIL